MGIASLVLGIVAVVVSFIPFCGTWAIIPALVGLILGIIAAVQQHKAKQPKGMAIAGSVCSAVAILIIIWWWVSVAAAVSSVATGVRL